MLTSAFIEGGIFSEALFRIPMTGGRLLWFTSYCSKSRKCSTFAESQQFRLTCNGPVLFHCLCLQHFMRPDGEFSRAQPKGVFPAIFADWMQLVAQLSQIACDSNSSGPSIETANWDVDFGLGDGMRCTDLTLY
jgi:hypothetical protein